MTQRSPLAGLATETPVASEPIIDITETALAKLVELRAEEPDADQLGLRLEVVSAPGEDFRYELGFEEYLSAAFTDEVRTHTGSGDSPEGSALKVMIPGKDVESLTGATLDFTESQGLVIRNPNRPSAPNVEGLIGDDELSAQVRELVATEVNPALAVHGGFVTYVGHDGEGTAYMTMGSPADHRRQGPHRPHHRRQPVLQLTVVRSGRPRVRLGVWAASGADAEPSAARMSWLA
jgi:Fe/S biogenesis protein NfuA